MRRIDKRAKLLQKEQLSLNQMTDQRWADFLSPWFLEAKKTKTKKKPQKRL